MARLLVVDDEPSIAATTSALLRNLGHEAETSLTLAEARQRLTQPGIDCLIVDIFMPDGDGLQFLQEVRAADPTFPAVVITGHLMEGDSATSRRLAALPGVPLLAKPFRIGELAERVNAVLSSESDASPVVSSA